MPLLSVEELTVSFTSEAGQIEVLDKVGFELKPGNTLGVVGESGCGKSVTALSIMRLLPKPSGQIKHGKILFAEKDLVSLPADTMRNIRGNRIAMIFQDPMTALNPVHRIGKQLMEVYQLHFPELNKQQRKVGAIKMLTKVGISDAEERFNEYPHQLSGGMRQRVMIAMALACEPEILIADEPTTALDVTIQAQILDLMQQLQRDTGMAIIFITHDLGVIAEMCDEVVVMYAGRVVEQAKVKDLFANPKHPYTQGLLASIPRLSGTPKTILHTIPGQVPSLVDMPRGCRFNNRCTHSSEQCFVSNPKHETAGNNHQVACFNWQGISA
jgi:peptide/nickel transport system ATP-binding protein